MYDDFVLGIGGLTDNIYLGKLNRDKTMWLNKRDITNNFFQVALQRFNGCETEIVSSSGKRYLLTCVEITDDNKLKEEEN